MITKINPIFLSRGGNIPFKPSITMPLLQFNSNFLIVIQASNRHNNYSFKTSALGKLYVLLCNIIHYKKSASIALKCFKTSALGNCMYYYVILSTIKKAPVCLSIGDLTVKKEIELDKGRNEGRKKRQKKGMKGTVGSRSPL